MMGGSSSKKATGGNSSLSRAGSIRSPTWERKKEKPSSTILTPYQVTLIRGAWSHISRSGTTHVGALIMRKLLTKDPAIKQMFQHVSVIEAFHIGLTPGLGQSPRPSHPAAFVELLQTAVDLLEDFEALGAHCQAIGANHASFSAYGFSLNFWDLLGRFPILPTRSDSLPFPRPSLMHADLLAPANAHEYKPPAKTLLKTQGLVNLALFSLRWEDKVVMHWVLVLEEKR